MKCIERRFRLTVAASIEIDSKRSLSQRFTEEYLSAPYERLFFQECSRLSQGNSLSRGLALDMSSETSQPMHGIPACTAPFLQVAALPDGCRPLHGKAPRKPYVAGCEWSRDMFVRSCHLVPAACIFKSDSFGKPFEHSRCGSRLVGLFLQLLRACAQFGCASFEDGCKCVPRHSFAAHSANDVHGIIMRIVDKRFHDLC